MIGWPDRSPVAFGGSSVSSVTNRSRVWYCDESSSSWSRSPMRMCTCSYMRSMCGLYHSRTSAIWPRHSRFGSASAVNSSTNFFQCSRASFGGSNFSNDAHRAVAGDEMVERALGVRRAHALHELQHAERGQLVVRVVGPAQHREQILDVRGLEELEPAVLHERNLALRQLDFEHVAVRAGAEQHGLAPQRDARFARRQHARADELGLGRQVVDRHQLGTRTLAAHRQQVLAVLARRIRHQRVGGVENALAGAEVLRQRDRSPPWGGSGPGIRGCSRPRRRGTSRWPARRRRPP